MGLVELDLFYMKGSSRNIKIRLSSAFDPQHSISPVLYHSLCFQAAMPTPLGEVKACPHRHA